jgi:hypothetical protein
MVMIAPTGCRWSSDPISQSMWSAAATSSVMRQKRFHS